MKKIWPTLAFVLFLAATIGFGVTFVGCTTNTTNAKTGQGGSGTSSSQPTSQSN